VLLLVVLNFIGEIQSKPTMSGKTIIYVIRGMLYLFVIIYFSSIYMYLYILLVAGDFCEISIEWPEDFQPPPYDVVVAALEADISN